MLSCQNIEFGGVDNTKRVESDSYTDRLCRANLKLGTLGEYYKNYHVYN